MASVFLHIQSAFRKINLAALKQKSCRLTKEEVFAISIHHAISEAIGDYEMWEFDEDGQLIEE